VKTYEFDKTNENLLIW